MSIQPTFKGDVQLAGWSESHTSGCKVTFWLADPSELEAFRVMTVRKGNTAGQRLACVLVEIGDNEEPVQPEPPTPRKDTRGPLCREACDLCKMPKFQEWANEDYVDGTPCEERAKDVILSLCGVESRKDLDTNADAAADFRNRIRIPFMQWMRERR